MPLDSLISCVPRPLDSADRRYWADGMEFLVPRAILDSANFDRHPTTNEFLVPPQTFPQLVPWAKELRLRAAFTETPPLSSHVPFSYHYVPASLRNAVAHLIGRWRYGQRARWAVFPRWPLDLSADFLADLAGLGNAIKVRGKTPVIVTHDLDSAEGVANCLRDFAPLEEAVGARSLNFVVPSGFPLDRQILEELKDRGHELGIHGFDHSNKTPFATPAVRRQRLNAATNLVQQLGIRGYRAPSLLRTRPLLRDLAGLYEFDSSVPTSGGLFPVPNNGCATARPFQIEGIWELPLSLARDGSLRFLGYSSDEILEVWKTCSRRIAESGGVVVLLTHCERRFSGNPEMLRSYRDFVEFIAASPEFGWSNATEVLKIARSVNLQTPQGAGAA